MKKRFVLGILFSVSIIVGTGIKAYHMYANVHHKLDDILSNQDAILQNEQREVADTNVTDIVEPTAVREAVQLTRW